MVAEADHSVCIVVAAVCRYQTRLLLRSEYSFSCAHCAGGSLRICFLDCSICVVEGFPYAAGPLASRLAQDRQMSRTN